MARLVVPGYPHHVTQRGNRRQRTFFEEADYQAYIGLIGELIDIAAMRDRISDWRRYLSEDESPELLDDLRRHTNNGRPAGSRRFIEQLEELTGRRLQRLKSGPGPGS